MTVASKTKIDCDVYAEVVEDCGAANDAASARGAPVITKFVAEYVDIMAPHSGELEFKIVLRDRTMVTVRGDGLKYVAGSPTGSYGVTTLTAGGEVTVALFPIGEVCGVFCGDLSPSDQQ